MRNPRSGQRSKPSDEAEAAVLYFKPCTDLYLLPVTGEDAEAGYEDETDPLLECDIIVKEEMESSQDISIKSEPAD